MVLRLLETSSSSARSETVPSLVPRRPCSSCRALVSLSVMSRSSPTISMRESMSRIPVWLNWSTTRCRPSRTSMRACWISGSLTTPMSWLMLLSKACAWSRTTVTASATSVPIWAMTVSETVSPKFFSCFSYSARPAAIWASASSSWARASASWVSMSSSRRAFTSSILS